MGADTEFFSGELGLVKKIAYVSSSNEKIILV